MYKPNGFIKVDFTFFAKVLFFCFLPIYVLAEEQWQIASKSETVNFGQKIVINIVKLEAAAD
jgi:hypothetical protein